MPAFSLVGDATVSITPAGGATRVLTDFADGTIFDIDYVSDLINSTTGKEGNTVFVKDERGRNGKGSMRILKGSSDDNYLNGLFTDMKSSFGSGTKILTIDIVRKIVDGTGTTLTESFNLQGCLLTQMPKTSVNVHGDTEQAISVWNMVAADVNRSIS